MSDAFRDQMSKDFGGDVSGARITASQRKRFWYCLGNLALNKSINHRGLGAPGGQMTELFGEEASGKTLLAIMALISAQKQNGIAAFIDVEGALDVEFATKLGVDVDNLIYIGPTKIRTISGVTDSSSPITFEDVFMVIEYILQKSDEMYEEPPPGVIVWDSISMTNSLADLGLKSTKEGVQLHNKEKKSVADQGRIAKDLRQNLQRTMARLHNSSIALIATNHIFDIILKPGQYSVEKTRARGGRAPKYHSRLRLEFSKVKGEKGKIRVNPENKKSPVIGERLSVYVEKNSVGPPFSRVELNFFFGKNGEISLDYYAGYFEHLLASGILTVHGSWYWYTTEAGETVKVQGKNIEKLLELAPELGKQDDTQT